MVAEDATGRAVLIFAAPMLCSLRKREQTDGDDPMIDPLGGPAYWWPFVLGFAISYLIGSIPFGLILTKSFRSRRSARHRLRQYRCDQRAAHRNERAWRSPRSSLDMRSRVRLPVWVASGWFGPDMAVVAGLGAVLGHCFPVWLKFNGGKGVATAAGVVLTMTPLAGLLALVGFPGIVVTLTPVRLARFRSACGDRRRTGFAFLLGHVQAAELFVLIALVIIVKHHANIRRLLAGEESKALFRQVAARRENLIDNTQPLIES